MKTIKLGLICCFGLLLGFVACSSRGASSTDEVAAGKTPEEMAQHVFAKYKCDGCHTLGSGGKFGFTSMGSGLKQNSEGCVAMLTSMSVIVHVSEEQRNPEQKLRAQRFNEYGCTVCHQVQPGQMSLTQTGAKLASLHLSCPEVQKLLAGKTS